MPSSAVLRSWSVAYVVLVATHLGALLADADPLADVTQCLLMPALAGVLVAATRWPRGHVVTWALAALGASFLGDAVPRLLTGDAAFLAMVGCFLLAQVAYVVAFAPRVRRSVVRTAPAWLAAYAVVLVVLVAVCAPHAGTLLVPVAVYGGVLTAMAVLATGLGRVGAVGGAVFLVSDALIALGRFVPGWDLAGHDVWVMLTYTVGQALLVVAVARDNRERRRARPVVRVVRPASPRDVDNVVALVAVRRGLRV
ncbi:lysoplasmalogenase [Cellulomonas palmilytica]|uniref:lysoplasmalogenase n=1 Tax=Cellulomonas palmilytica TaxID=2608402 RepID=UPI001F31DBF3|nr:lysoplasmalogenase [Cellulomonas palmilytica]UJP39196.1 lysoplasmalogenase [Cellulomonas palmilytica]